jgi:protein gp37
MKTKIEWADSVWNPTTGCTKVSQGCKNCYAKKVHDMRHKAYQEGKQLPPQYSVPFETVLLHENRLEQPFHWRKPQRVFVNSMSDLFHPDVPDDFIVKVFAVMFTALEHTFMILTKRPARMLEWINKYPASYMDREAKRVWLGVSVENQQAADERIPLLLQTPAAVRFVSCEPLLGAVDLTNYYPWSHSKAEAESLQFIQSPNSFWVICGGESGPGARPMHPDWARALVRQCSIANVPIFVKQMGSAWAKENAANSKGGDITEFPTDLRIREFPANHSSEQEL